MNNWIKVGDDRCKKVLENIGFKPENTFKPISKPLPLTNEYYEESRKYLFKKFIDKL
jgi:hypothetical protein